MIVQLHNIYAVSADVVAREIEGELIIVPLSAGVGDLEDELYTLNETGKAIWQRLDGLRSLQEVAADLSIVYQAPLEEIQQDVCGLVAELLRRRMLVEVSHA